MSYRSRSTYRVPTYSRVRSSEHRMGFGCLGILLLALLCIGIAAPLFWNYEYGTEHMVTLTVGSKDDQASGSNGHNYLIFDEVHGVVYEDTDAWFHGKLNSSDLYLKLKVGRTYRCDVYGWRNHVFSSYQDLLWCNRLPAAAAP